MGAGKDLDHRIHQRLYTPIDVSPIQTYHPPTMNVLNRLESHLAITQIRLFRHIFFHYDLAPVDATRLNLITYL
jgi:hypothetical protein